jgi:hypothetical protein
MRSEAVEESKLKTFPLTSPLSRENFHKLHTFMSALNSINLCIVSGRAHNVIMMPKLQYAHSLASMTLYDMEKYFFVRSKPPEHHIEAGVLFRVCFVYQLMLQAVKCLLVLHKHRHIVP